MSKKNPFEGAEIEMIGPEVDAPGIPADIGLGIPVGVAAALAASVATAGRTAAPEPLRAEDLERELASAKGGSRTLTRKQFEAKYPRPRNVLVQLGPDGEPVVGKLT